MFKYDKWYIIGKLLYSTFRICKNICKFAKFEFLFTKSSYIVKMLANDKLYIFEKPLTMQFQICKKFCKISNNLTKNLQIFVDGLFANNLQKFLCAIHFFRSKQRFSLLQEKAVIPAECLRTQAVSIKARFKT